jgi:hypothetical protein
MSAPCRHDYAGPQGPAFFVALAFVIPERADGANRE